MNGYLDHYGKVISEREVKQIFSEVDFEKNGAIGYTEFIIATISQQELNSVAYLKAAFNKFDKDNDKTITSEELRQILGGEDKVSQDLLKELMDLVDSDGDGLISFKEFQAFMIKRR